MSDITKNKFAQRQEARRKEYQSVMGLVTDAFDEIQLSLNSNVPLEVITEDLNELHAIKTSAKTVETCLYRIRKKRHSTASTITSRKNRTAKECSESGVVGSTDSALAPEADWNDVEQLVGYRLSDEVRDYVSVVGNKVVENFPKDARGRAKNVRSKSVRDELTKLRREVSRK